MNYNSKVELAHAETQEKGIFQSNANPLGFRLLRKLGIRVAPPYYRSFISSFSICFLYFTPLFALVYGMLSGQAIQEVVTSSLIAGLVFALAMSVFYHVRKKQLGLTKWESLGLKGSA